MSWTQELHAAKAELAKRSAEPWKAKLEQAVHGKEAVSTAALLDLLGVPKTTGNARRIAKTMRALNFVPIKSRLLMPGGYRNTVARGWARPVRGERRQVELMQGQKVCPVNKAQG